MRSNESLGGAKGSVRANMCPVLREEAREQDGRPTAYWVGRGLKSALVMLLLLPLLKPGLEQYDGKGMSWRILVFPLACFIVPVLWRATGSRPPYPYLADNLLVVAPLTDVLWNTLDTYDRLWGWDKLNHLSNSIIFAAVIGLSGQLGIRSDRSTASRSPSGSG